MAARIDIDGVSTWTETRGSGEHTVVLLHGGLGNSDDLLDSIGAELEHGFRVVAFDRRGHGYTADTDEPFHYDDMATHAIAVLERARRRIAGAPRRDGATAASWRCSSRFAGPTSSTGSCSSASTSTSTASIELDFGDGAPAAVMLEALRNAFARRCRPLSRRGREVHGDGHHRADADDRRPRSLGHPTLVLVGDDDLVRLDHTVALYEALPAGRLCVVPGASHAVVIERPRFVAAVIAEFLQGPEPPETLIPIRRGR